MRTKKVKEQETTKIDKLEELKIRMEKYGIPVKGLDDPPLPKPEWCRYVYGSAGRRG